MSFPHRRTLAALTAAGLCLIPAVSEAAKPKKRADYVYNNKSGTRRIAIGTFGGKVGSINALLVLKKGGQVCAGSPSGATPVVSDFEHPYKVSSSGSFSFTHTHVRSAYGFTGKVKVSGRFTSSTNAEVKVTYSDGSCSGSLSTKHARYVSPSAGR